MGAGNPQDAPSAGVLCHDPGATEQPVMDAAGIAEAVFDREVGVGVLLCMLVAGDHGVEVVGMDSGVEVVQSQVAALEAEAFDEAPLDMDAPLLQIDFPDAFGGRVEH
ncbi:hypothetical protein D3C81_1274370 [compost metagenome]